MTAPNVSKDSQSLHIETHGNGPDIICLHATGHSGRDFLKLSERLGRRFRFHLVDWPGQGASEADGVPASSAHYASLLPGVYNAIGCERAILLGNSIGGAAAIEFAAGHADRVQALILCNSAGLAPITWLSRLYCRSMEKRFAAGAKGRPDFPAWFAKYYEQILTTPASEWRRIEIVMTAKQIAPILSEAWKSFASPSADVRHLMPNLSMPVLFAWGKRDRAVRWSWSRKAARTVPNHFVKLFDAGHSAFLETPDEFDDEFLRFTADLS